MRPLLPPPARNAPRVAVSQPVYYVTRDDVWEALADTVRWIRRRRPGTRALPLPSEPHTAEWGYHAPIRVVTAAWPEGERAKLSRVVNAIRSFHTGRLVGSANKALGRFEYEVKRRRFPVLP